MSVGIPNRMGMSHLASCPLQKERDPSRVLLWTKCWRSVYAKEAAILGYLCKWDSGTLAFYRGAEPRHWPSFVASVAPDTREFVMWDLCEKAEAERRRLISNKTRRYEEQEELNAEVHSRMAAGEASLLIEKFRLVRHDHRARESFLALAPFIAGAFAYHPMPKMSWAPISRYSPPHRLPKRK